MEQQLPVFVYGTLRPGEGNHHCVAAAMTAASAALLEDHALYVSGLPWVVPQPGGRVVGDLIDIAPARYAATLARLDRLEGYRPGSPDGLYVRVQVVVRLDGSTDSRRAWVYLAGRRSAARLTQTATPVASGDWKEASCPVTR